MKYCVAAIWEKLRKVGKCNICEVFFFVWENTGECNPLCSLKQYDSARDAFPGECFRSSWSCYLLLIHKNYTSNTSYCKSTVWYRNSLCFLVLLPTQTICAWENCNGFPMERNLQRLRKAKVFHLWGSRHSYTLDSMKRMHWHMETPYWHRGHSLVLKCILLNGCLL